MKTKLKKGRYYIHQSSHIIYYVQYVNLGGVPSGWTFSYRLKPGDHERRYGWVTYETPSFGDCGEVEYKMNVSEIALKLIPKYLEKGITPFVDDAFAPSVFLHKLNPSPHNKL